MMKIYLLFMAIFYSLVSYCEDSSEANMKISLTLVHPLKVSCSDMNFGTVVAGSKGNQSFGYVNIKGRGYTSVAIKLESPTRTRSGINLIGPTGSKPMEVLLNSSTAYATKNNIYELENSPLTLPWNGDLRMKIVGVLNVPEDQKAGVYRGTLTFKVRYN